MTFDHSTCGNYSREETIQGQKLFPEIRYSNQVIKNCDPEDERFCHLKMEKFIDKTVRNDCRN